MTCFSRGLAASFRMCARVPEDAVVYSTNKGLVDLASPSLSGLERKLHEDHANEMAALAALDIQLRVLRKSDFPSAVAQGEAYQSLFATGVRLGVDGRPVVVQPQSIAPATPPIAAPAGPPTSPMRARTSALERAADAPAAAPATVPIALPKFRPVFLRWALLLWHAG